MLRAVRSSLGRIIAHGVRTRPCAKNFAKARRAERPASQGGAGAGRPDSGFADFGIVSTPRPPDDIWRVFCWRTPLLPVCAQRLREVSPRITRALSSRFKLKPNTLCELFETCAFVKSAVGFARFLERTTVTHTPVRTTWFRVTREGETRLDKDEAGRLAQSLQSQASGQDLMARLKAAEEGVRQAFDEIVRTSNTFLCHRGVSAANKAIFAFNKGVFVQALRHQGVAYVEYVYQGESDSGSMEYIFFADKNHAEIELADDTSHVLVASLDTNPFRDLDQQALDLVLSSQPLEEALIDFLDGVVDLAGHAGYENNDGGRGQVRFFVEDATTDDGVPQPAGTIVIDHTDYIVQEAHDSATF